MQFLITNDDGIDAPGLELLARVAANFGSVVIVAPKHEQSGISHRVSFNGALSLTETQDGIFHLDATPADCVRVAIATLELDFDWVLSGINNGANLGVDVFYSGTVAAAREASLHGIPAIAMSQFRKNFPASFDWKSMESVAAELLNRLVSSQPTPNHWINVNFPDRPNVAAGKIEFVDCQVDMSPMPAMYEKSDKGLEPQFRYADRPRNSGQDVDVCFGGNVSISHCGNCG